MCDYLLKIDSDEPKVTVLTPEGTELTMQTGDTVTSCIEAVATVIEDDIEAWGCAA